MDGDEKKISIENYKERLKAVKLHMFAIILRTSYDRERKMFNTPEKLQENQVLKFRLLPELLPMGHEDQTQLIVGVQIDKKGEKSVARIGVWRNETHVFYEKKNVVFHKPIIS